jgi:hypothetical protein
MANSFDNIKVFISDREAKTVILLELRYAISEHKYEFSSNK